jgi:hypothetical protein
LLFHLHTKFNNWFTFDTYTRVILWQHYSWLIINKWLHQTKHWSTQFNFSHNPDSAANTRPPCSYVEPLHTFLKYKPIDTPHVWFPHTHCFKLIQYPTRLSTQTCIINSQEQHVSKVKKRISVSIHQKSYKVMFYRIHSSTYI